MSDPANQIQPIQTILLHLLLLPLPHFPAYLPKAQAQLPLSQDSSCSSWLSLAIVLTNLPVDTSSTTNANI